MDQENYKKGEGGKQLTSSKFSLYFEVIHMVSR